MAETRNRLKPADGRRIVDDGPPDHFEEAECRKAVNVSQAIAAC